MAKEEKPLEYEPRDQDTKTLAQRLALDYLKRPSRFNALKRRVICLVPLVCAVGVFPFFIGIGHSRRVFTNGPMSRAHASFENRCENCHAPGVSHVRDRECQVCHAGSIHSANTREVVACGSCHAEHRGNLTLSEVNDNNCIQCHGNLTAHGTGIKVAANVRNFRESTHPDWLPEMRADERPLKLNHAAHMPLQAKMIRNIRLPMKCSDCHESNLDEKGSGIYPVTFEKHCRSCHTQELQFDRFQILGPDAQPSPHTKDPVTIHAFIQKTYEEALAKDPEIWTKNYLGRDSKAAGREQWLATVVQQSESYLFENKCRYCHEYESVQPNGYPVIKKVNAISGRYADGIPEGTPWLTKTMFNHRAHRAEDCESCHRTARKSTLTSDVLIPGMPSCTVCHGVSRSALDNCAQCHVYHDHSRDKEKLGRPVDQLITSFRSTAGVF